MEETATSGGATQGAGIATEGSLPHPPQPRVLRRSADQRILGGVAGGLGDYFGVSPTWFRLAFAGCGLAIVLLGFITRVGAAYVPPVLYPYASPLKLLFKTFAGVGLLAYLALWLVVPPEDRPGPAASRPMRAFPSFVSLFGEVLLIVGGGVLGAVIGLWRLDVIWAFLLIWFGVVLFRHDAMRENAGTTEASVAAPETKGIIEPVIRVQRARRERSPLGWLTLGAALLAFGVTAALGGAGAFHLSLVRYPAVGLLVLGIGLLIGAAWGRARWLILPAAVAVPIVLAASVIQVPLQGGFRPVNVTPKTTSDLQPEYHTLVGNVSLSLYNLDLGGATAHIDATSALGTIWVTVPTHALVEVYGDVGGGHVEIGRFSSDGLGQTFHRTMIPKGRVQGTIVLHLRVGIGDVTVFRYASAPPPKHNKDNSNHKANGKGSNP